MCAHLALRLASFPSGMVFEPMYSMEDAIESFFGQMKTIKKETGTTTVATGIQAIQLLHNRQQRQPKKVP